VSWVELAVVLVVSHLAGDFLLQTDWQARYKYGGLGPDPVRRRALRNHMLTYMLAFLPALAWVASELGFGAAIGLAVLVGVPHWIQDDGRLLDAYMAVVKRVPNQSPGLRIAVDQSFHLVALFLAALIVAG
jgi:hypothetical protein